MENNNFEFTELKLLQHLGYLRRMMVHNHELENLSEFVLHDICTGPCFHVKKAAYFVNNPDFHCLKGITGYSSEESALQNMNHWNHQKQFSAYKKSSQFNQQVRSHNHAHFDKGSSSEKYTVAKIADSLEIASPSYLVWDLKHANHGLLIYEALPVANELIMHDHIFDSLHHLSFCPIF